MADINCLATQLKIFQKFLKNGISFSYYAQQIISFKLLTNILKY